MGNKNRKLNKTRIAAIVKGIKLGATYEHAALAAGVTYNSFNNWMNRAKEVQAKLDNGVIDCVTDDYEILCIELFGAVKKAEGDAVAGWLAQLNKAAKLPQHWQAAAWRLERRYPDTYGRRVVDTNVKGTGPNGELEVVHSADEVASAILTKLAAIGSAALESDGDGDSE